MSTREGTGLLLATGSVVLIGGSVAAASLLHDYPLAGGQAVRYAVAAVALLSWTLLRRERVTRPTGRDWLGLALLAAIGMAGYGLTLVYATSMTSPANVGVSIGAAPLAIVLVRAAVTRTKASRTVVVGAMIVAAGSVIAQAVGDGHVVLDAGGLFWSFLALIGVASITLLGAPVIARLGSMTVTTYACAISSAMLFTIAVLTQAATGTPALRTPTPAEAWALGFLSIGVTTIVFLTWYGALERLGASRVGLFNGLVPAASLLAVAVIGQGAPTATQLAGAALVLVGILVGLRGPTHPSHQKPWQLGKLAQRRAEITMVSSAPADWGGPGRSDTAELSPRRSWNS